jgi:hypothetical protein
MSFFQYSHAYSRILSDSIKYSIDFKFNDGIFLNFKQVRANQAIPFKNIISKENYLSDTFVSDVLSKKKLFIFVNGEKKEILISDIWGYAKNGVLYVQYSKSFYRIPSVGSISFFVANVEVKYQSQVDPWNSNYYNTMSQDYTTKELRKFLIDFKDGTLYDYSINNISKLISENTSLFKEFTALKKRKRKQMAFIFIRRFNESRPLFFPTY